jgi:tryptophan 2,3-dioxygenase
MSASKPPSTPPLSITPAALTYASYLRLDALLALQESRSDPPEHDEHLFILVHQVYELWFKQVLHELDRLDAMFARCDTPAVLATFKRILTILKTLVAQVDVIETMTPIDFASFRTRLSSASGFQSLQFRLIEVRLGKRDRRVVDHFSGDGGARARLEIALSAPSLFERFMGYLQAMGVSFAAGTEAGLLHVYRHEPNLVSVCERMVDLDEGLQEWRYRHMKMVERTIGLKSGTGGSAGAEYLRTTLFQALFPELWALRSQL